MRYRVAVEDMEPERHVAWVLDLAGCFSSGPTQAEALARVREEIAAYAAWVLAHDETWPPLSEPFAPELVEVFRSFPSHEDPSYLVNAFFDDDRRPLGYWDVAAGLRLLEWSREDLLDVVRPFSPEELGREIPGELQGSLLGILNHVATAENWYLAKFGLALARGTLPSDRFEKLTVVRDHLRQELPGLMGETRITTHRDERWSARKILRRALWHERAHKQQIMRYLLRQA